MEKNYALLIGVGKRKSDSQAMSVTAIDAKRMRDELVSQCGFSRNTAVVLNNRNAGAKSILEQLDALKKKTQGSDANLVIVYFSGHGCLYKKRPFLICWDTSEDLEGSALPGDAFVEALERISAKKLLVLLDCCHAGSFAKPLSVPFAMHPFLKNSSNRVILTASHAEQKSYLSTPVSLFTYALIEGISGKYFFGGETAVTIFDLAMYVRERVIGLSRAKQQPQFNVLREGQTHNFEVVRYPNGKPTRRPFSDSFKLLNSEGKSIDTSGHPKRDMVYRKKFIWMVSNTLTIGTNTGNVVQAARDAFQVNLYGNKTIKKYLTAMPASDGAIKVGRSKHIGEIIHRTSQSSGEMINVWGMGGLGKTTVLKMIQQELQVGSSHVAWIDGREGLQKGFTTNLGLINSLGLSEILIQGDKELDEARKYELIITGLKNLDGNCLLLIDGLKQEKDSSLNAIKLLRSLLPAWTVFLTSRQTVPLTETYQLPFLDAQSLQHLFYGLYTIEKNQKISKNIVTRMGFHTLGVEMLARTAQTLRLSLTELQKRLDEKGLDISKTTKISLDHSDSIVTSVKEYLLGIFEIAEIKTLELLLLQNMSVIPADMTEQKISAGALYVFINYEHSIEADEEEFAILLRGLHEKGWLLQTVEKSDDGIIEEYYQIHPLIEEFIKIKYPPTTQDCLGLISLFTKLSMSNVELDKRLRYTGFKISLLDGINEKSQAMFNLQMSLIDDLIFQGWWDDASTALADARELFNSIEYSVENQIRLLDLEMRAYEATQQDSSALESCVELVKLSQQAGIVTYEDYIMLARLHSMCGNHSDAQQAFSSAHRLYKTTSVGQPIPFADLCWLQAELIQAKKNIINVRAARLYIKGFQLYERYLKKESLVLGRIYLEFAQLTYAAGQNKNFKKALKYLTLSKKIYQKLYGDVHPQLLAIYIWSARIRLTHLNKKPDEISIALSDLTLSEKVIHEFHRNELSQEVYKGLIECHRLLKTGDNAILSYRHKLKNLLSNTEIRDEVPAIQ
jgi:hypothetical protein